MEKFTEEQLKYIELYGEVKETYGNLIACSPEEKEMRDVHQAFRIALLRYKTKVPEEIRKSFGTEEDFKVYYEGFAASKKVKERLLTIEEAGFEKL